MNATQYQDGVASEIRRELAQRLVGRKAGVAGYVDTIIMSYNKHGLGKVGFSCEFSGAQTAVSGMTLVEFARRHFGSGRLVISSRNEIGETWHVVANEVKGS